MKYAHNVIVSVFEYEENGTELIEKALKLLFPFNIDKFITIKKVDGFNEKKILIYEVKIENNGLINKVLDNLKTKITDITKIIPERIDDDLNFFIRLDKNKLCEDIYQITESGNCFHIKIKIAAFPKNRHNGMKVLEKIFL